MRCSIEIDAEALRQNYQVFQRLITGAEVVPVVKSNAYGHGLAEIYRALSPLQLPWLAVNYLSEAAQLRHLGYAGRIMVVGPTGPQALLEARELEADIFLTEPHILKAWCELPSDQRPKAHLKIDTGMSRQGFRPDEIDSVFHRLSTCKEGLVGICSHFSNVEDVLEQTYAKQQLDHFMKVYDRSRELGFNLMPHMAASSSALLMQASRMALVRIGISTYGLWPSRTTQLSFLQSYGSMIELKPCMSWRTEVALVKNIRAGQYIGYGCSYKAVRDMVIAVLPVGYYEGYPRLASNRGHVLIQGQRCPIVGRICMNMMMVDISHLQLSEPIFGAPVTLIGRDGQETIEAAHIAEWAETIHYEIVTQLNPAIPRRIKEG